MKAGASLLLNVRLAEDDGDTVWPPQIQNVAVEIQEKPSSIALKFRVFSLFKRSVIFWSVSNQHSVLRRAKFALSCLRNLRCSPL